MRFATQLALYLSLLTPAVLPAEVNIGCIKSTSATTDHFGTPSPDVSSTGLRSLLPTKLDLPGSVLVLPYFEIDTNNPEGATTLFAVRNVTSSPAELEIFYFGFGGQLLAAPDEVDLGPRETLTVNLRFAGPFPVDPDGFSRGGVGIVGQGNSARVIAGDYFQVIPDQDFASGDRLLNLDPDDPFYYDLCTFTESRFLNGGAFTGGSTFTLVTKSAGGVGMGAEPTVFANVYDQAGNLHESCEIFTDQIVLRIPIEQLTDQAFGTVELEFSDAGQVITEFDATGRFSVGLRGVCLPAF